MSFDTIPVRYLRKQAIGESAETWTGNSDATCHSFSADLRYSRETEMAQWVVNVLKTNYLTPTMTANHWVRMHARYEPDWGLIKIEPRHSTQLDNAIKQSGWILDLGDDWDQEGSVGYGPDTLERATDFLRALAKQAEGEIPTPDINPADDGSIDLFWQLANKDLLLNIPAEGGDPIAFYGEAEHGGAVSGEIPQFLADDASDFRKLVIAWLYE